MKENDVIDLMIKILTENDNFKMAMVDKELRFSFNEFISKIYTYVKNNDSISLQSLEEDFLIINEKINKYIKEEKENE